MPIIDVNIEKISFWLGFLAATLFWWLVSRVKPLLPRWYQHMRQGVSVLNQRNFASVEEALRRETLRLAQRQHIASALFSLDEVLVQPYLLVPPNSQDPSAVNPDVSIAKRVVPYLPDWPELAAPFGVPLITPTQALMKGRHLAIIGHAGTGKTVVLAQLASQLARGEIGSDQNLAPVPIFLNIADLDLSQLDPLGAKEVLIKAAAGRASGLVQTQVPRFLQSVFNDEKRKVILLLDGLDELPPEQLTAAVGFLTKLRELPRLQMVAAASIDYLDGLTKAGFYPLAVAAWKQSQRLALMKNWSTLWQNMLPVVDPQKTAHDLNPLLMDCWLSAENSHANPLEWTLRLWGAYAGDLSGSSEYNAIESHLKRFLPDASRWPALQQLAHAMVLKQSHCMPLHEVENILAQTVQSHNMVVESSVQTELAAGGSSDNISLPSKKSPRNPRSNLTARVNLVDTLVQCGVLSRHANDQIRFTNPVFTGFLASQQLSSSELMQCVDQIGCWTIAGAALQYVSTRGDNVSWISDLTRQADLPLYSNILAAARWLREAAPGAEWRVSLMRTLAGLIQNEMVPFSIRARMIAAIFLSRDPSAVKLFKQLLASKSAQVRRLALLGCGASASPQCIDAVLSAVADPSQDVRFAACLTLAAIQEETSINALVEILHHGDEEIRQAAAEALAQHAEVGQQILKEAVGDKDLLTRRAAVYGLLRVPAPWAKKALEQVAVEDGQWIVRNAAAQALEVLQNQDFVLPDPLPEPSESPWLLAFASKLGMGILPGQPATQVLLQAVKSGNQAEQEAALYYLQDQADDNVLAEIMALLGAASDEIQEPLLNALRWIALSDPKLLQQVRPDRQPALLYQ